MSENGKLTEWIGLLLIVMMGSMIGYECGGWLGALICGTIAGTVAGPAGIMMGFGTGAFYSAVRMCCM